MLIAYKASAGSGKTYTLVREYLRVALQLDWAFREILALTFTNKAAGEMKERIVRELSSMAAETDTPSSMFQELQKSLEWPEEKLRTSSARLLKKILHHYSDFSLGTIDSFTHRVVKGFAYELKLPAGYEIEMDLEPVLAEVADVLIDRCGRGDEALTELLLEFTQTHMQERSRWDINRALVRFGKELFQEEALIHQQALEQTNQQALKDARNEVYAFQNSVIKIAKELAKNLLQLLEHAQVKEEDIYQGRRGFISTFRKLSENGNFAKALDSAYLKTSVEQGKWTGSKASASAKAAIESVSEEVISAYRQLQEIDNRFGRRYAFLELVKKNLYAFSLLTEFSACLETLKKEEGFYLMPEFQAMVYAYVSRQEAPVIYERLGERYHHLLIDEFQDTSVVQWRNLLPMLEHALFSEGLCLVVGDPKQAIYRFRGGRVEQFVSLPNIEGSEEDAILAARKATIQSYRYQEEYLNTNYRSHQEVVNFNNSFYNYIQESGLIADQRIYAHQEQIAAKANGKGFVQIEFLDPEEKTGLNALRGVRVKTLIEEHLALGFALRDIAILVNANRNGAQLAAYLMGEGIPVVSPESMLVAQSEPVRLLVAAIRYLERPAEITPRAILTGVLMRFFNHTLSGFEQIHWTMPAEEMDQRISEILNQHFSTVKLRNLRIHELVARLLELFGISLGTDPFVQGFFDVVLGFTRRYGGSITHFLEYWEEHSEKFSVVYPDELNAVRIMSIHKSKGLQFPVVMVADADWEVRHSRAYLWIYDEDPELKGLPMVLVSNSKELEKTRYSDLYEYERQMSQLDAVNKLYVATTRAEQRLYLLSTRFDESKNVRPDKTACLLKQYLVAQNLWDGFKTYGFGVSDTFDPPKSGAAAVTYAFRHTPESGKSGRSLKMKRSFGGNVFTKRGEGFHELASKWSDEHHLAEWLKAHPGASPLLEVLYKMIRENPALQYCFQANATVYAERDFYHESIGVFRPDRLVVHRESGAAALLDFKTGAPYPEHVQQIDAYAHALMELGFKVTHRVLVYPDQEKVIQR